MSIETTVLSANEEIDVAESKVRIVLDEMRRSLSEKLRKKEVSISDLSSKWRKAETEISSMKSELDSHRLKLTQAKDDIARLEKSKNDAMQEAIEKSHSNELEKAQLARESERLSRGTRDLEVVRSQLEHTKMELEGRKRRGEEQNEARYESIKNEFLAAERSYKTRIEELVRENDDIRQISQQNEQKMNDLRKHAAVLESQAKVNASEKQLLTAEYEQEKKRVEAHYVDQIRRSMEEPESRFKMLKDVSDAAEARYKQRFAEFDAENTRLRDSIGQSEAIYRERADEFERDVHALTTAKNEAVHQLQQSTQKIGDLEFRLEQVTKSRETLIEDFNRRGQELQVTYERNLKYLREQYRTVILLRSSNWRINDSRFSGLMNELLSELDEMPVGVFPHKFAYEKDIPEISGGESSMHGPRHFTNRPLSAGGRILPPRFSVDYEATDITERHSEGDGLTFPRYSANHPSFAYQSSSTTSGRYHSPHSKQYTTTLPSVSKTLFR